MPTRNSEVVDGHAEPWGKNEHGEMGQRPAVRYLLCCGFKSRHYQTKCEVAVEDAVSELRAL